MRLNVQLLGDASTDCIVWVRGRASEEDSRDAFKEFLSLDRIAPAATGRRPRTLRLVSAVWLLQEKLGLRIWTSQKDEPENLLLIAESRNFVRFDIPTPLENWAGKLYLEPFNMPEPKWFWFQLDFAKAYER